MSLAALEDSPAQTDRQRGREIAESAARDRAAFVCMIAYTDYAIDARVRREAETLAANGFRVRCITTRNGGPQPRFKMNGVDVQEVAVQKYRGKSTVAYVASYLAFLTVSSLACLRLLIKGELDVVHVHNIPDFLVFAGLLPRLAGRRVVLDVHDSVPETFATKFSGGSVVRKALALEERLSAFVAHRVICVNHLQREVLVSRGIARSKTFVSMNVPDPAIFCRSVLPVRCDRPIELFNLVYHGTMAERLGVDLIIQSVARLRDDIPVLRLHLWGHGDDLVAFQRLAQDLDVRQQVLFNPKGFPLHELPAQLAAMHVGVVGNRRSTATDLMLPVKLMEYVSQGIPAVAPRLKTITHYFTADMVAFYEPGDVWSLADAIRRLYSDAGARQRYAERARTFLTEHGWERQGGELVAFYRQLLEH